MQKPLTKLPKGKSLSHYEVEAVEAMEAVLAEFGARAFSHFVFPSRRARRIVAARRPSPGLALSSPSELAEQLAAHPQQLDHRLVKTRLSTHQDAANTEIDNKRTFIASREIKQFNMTIGANWDLRYAREPRGHAALQARAKNAPAAPVLTPQRLHARSVYVKYGFLEIRRCRRYGNTSS